MKKIISFFLCLIFVSLPVCAQIQDDFAGQTLDKNLKIRNYKCPIITDDLVELTLDKNLKIKKYDYKPIKDSFAESNKVAKKYQKKTVAINEVLPQVNGKSYNQQKRKTFATDSKNLVPVRVKVLKNLTTRKAPDEGDYVDFEIINDITINKNFYPKGTIVKARIETVSKNKAMGVPADLIVGNFSVNGNPLEGEINKVGANRSIWVYPAVYAGTWFFGLGLLCIPIRGGHAKIRTTEIYDLYYNPENL